MAGDGASRIRIRYLIELIERPWFYAPATTVVLAYAIHVTDTRTELVRGVRTLTLTLLAWLLPMMTALALAFRLALPFTGLQPLWNTQRATATLLVAAAALIFLINAAYQDGQSGESIARVVHYSRGAAALVLVPLVALAAYGLTLRAQQYGWTPQRIIAGACVVVASCYAVGYALAAVRGVLHIDGRRVQGRNRPKVDRAGRDRQHLLPRRSRSVGGRPGESGRAAAEGNRPERDSPAHRRPRVCQPLPARAARHRTMTRSRCA
jgi:hypothetical protein